MTTTKRIVTLALSSAILSLMAVIPADAFNPQPEPPGVTAFGIVETQAAAINLMVAPGTAEGGVEPTPFRVAVALYSADGQILSRAVRSVLQGTVETVQASGRELGAFGNNRMTVSVAVECLGDVRVRVECSQQVNVTLELFDMRDGKTSAIVPSITPTILPVISGTR